MHDSLLISVPIFGQHEYTHALVQDLERENADYIPIDNRGDYPRLGNERVIAPGENLGWAGGSDLGFRIAFSEGYACAMTLNNDTRLSKGFVAGMLDPRLPSDAGIVTPVYDDVTGHPQMVSDQKVPAAEYRPQPLVRDMPIVDGTAMMLSRELWRTVGGFDLRSFSKYGWGIDIDLCLRARAAGFGIYATEMAYINHFGKKTAEKHWGRRRYVVNAWLLAQRDMRRVHGRRWAHSLPKQVTTLSLDQQPYPLPG